MDTSARHQAARWLSVIVKSKAVNRTATAATMDAPVPNGSLSSAFAPCSARNLRSGKRSGKWILAAQRAEKQPATPFRLRCVFKSAQQHSNFSTTTCFRIADKFPGQSCVAGFPAGSVACSPGGCDSSYGEWARICLRTNSRNGASTAGEKGVTVVS